MRGRKPKPTALKIAQGNPTHQSKEQLERGLQLPSSLPQPPDHLTPRAKQEWNRLVPELHEIGMLATIDSDALAMYCETLADYIKARNEVKRKKYVGKRLNPAFNIINMSANRLMKLMAEFGLTPSARVRLNSNNSKKTSDPFEEFVNSA